MTARGDSDIAAIGALVADPARCRILLALGDGRALPASRLASEATAVAHRDPRAGYGRDLDYGLTDERRAFLGDLGVTIPARRRVVRYCIDWSEQRHHLSGALGRGLLDRLLELEWIRRAEVGRAVRVTRAGGEGLRETFGITLDVTE
jgi:hypothetical protein